MQKKLTGRLTCLKRIKNCCRSIIPSSNAVQLELIFCLPEFNLTSFATDRIWHLLYDSTRLRHSFAIFLLYS